MGRHPNRLHGHGEASQRHGADVDCITSARPCRARCRVCPREGSGRGLVCSHSLALRPVVAVEVRQVVTPFTSAGAGQVSGDRHTAYATVVFTDDGHADQAKKLAENAAAEWLSVQTGGTAFTNKIPSEIGEVVGVLAALAVLLLSVLLRRSAPSAATG